MATAATAATIASSFRSVPDMWHHRTGSTPGMEAFIYQVDGEWRSLSWRQAGQRVRALANALLAFELMPEQRCCIVADTSVEWILVDMAILCSGGATTTMFPSYNADSFAYIVKDCEAVIAFCDTQAQVDKLLAVRPELKTLRQVVVFDGQPTEDGFVVTLADFEAGGAKWGEDNPDSYDVASASIEPSRMATLMYTSGTTGDPKGVMLTHDAWVYKGEAIDQLGLMTPADRHLLFLPLSHVFAKVMEIIFIRLGIPTVVHADPNTLLDVMQQTRPTWMGAVPRIFERVHNYILADAKKQGPMGYRTFQWAISVGRRMSRVRQQGGKPSPTLRMRYALADRLVFSKIKARFGGRMRFFISGGAPLSKEIAEFLHACDILVLEGYGLTESAAASTVNIPSDFRFGTVGQPVPGCEIRIAEDGEILIRSRGVMAGYYKQPSDTAAAITEDGWLRTGDIGLLHPSGHLQITDRKKDIIVTAGGKNVAPAGFENRLKAECPYVAQAVMHGDRRAFCSALVSVDQIAIRRWAREQELSFTDYSDLVRKPEVYGLIQAAIDKVNRDLPSYETVKRFALLPTELTVEDGTLTPTMKVKRRVVEKRYQALLDAFYEGSVAIAV
jgi:long-chain acyl-CoA synthetase